MDLKGAQRDVHEWISKYGVRYFDELTNMIQLTEEVGEVARIISRRYGEQSEKESDKEKDLGEELADVIFVVLLSRNFMLNYIFSTTKLIAFLFLANAVSGSNIGILFPCFGS